MKKCFLCLMLLALPFSALCQDGTVEKSIFGIQTGILGIWIHNEFKLSDQISLRSEIGLEAGLFGGRPINNNQTGYLLFPTISVEPRWYYNLKKRTSKARNTADNAGNFVALKSSFLPDWFVISNYENIFVINQITIIPTWGIRRNIGNHFNYEVGVGIGYRYSFAKNAGFSENVGESAGNLHLRIGYRF